MIIEREDPHHPKAVALLTASHALMEELFPPEANNYLEIDQLCVPKIQFFVAREDDDFLGCVAISDEGDYAEVKSMFVDPSARGKGVGDALLIHLIDLAKQKGFPKIMLESGDALTAALKLYEKHGFTYCSSFGDYVEEPCSIYMELKLDR